MDGFTKKTISNSRGLDYTYWVCRSSAAKPALLLHHGFPDDHELWVNIIPFLRDLDHTIIIPDLLGYGETSKPSDAQLYNFKAMAQDMMEILDKEKQRKIVSVGHDWGSSLAQRVALFHPDRVVGLVILNVAYRPPGEANIKKTNELLVKTTGLPRLAYQEFFTSPHARELLQANLETAFHAFNGSDEGTKNFMEDLLCHDGALEAYIRSGKKQPLKPYAQRPGFKETWISRMKRDGFTGPLNWYHASLKNHHWNVEKELPQDRYRLSMPVLFVGCTKDAVCLTHYIQIPKQVGLLPDLTVEEIDSGHWCQYWKRNSPPEPRS